MDDVEVISRRVNIESAETEDVKVFIKDKRRKVGRVEVGAQQLLPAIPDDITIELIAPKLSAPFPYVGNLSSISRGWRQAIRSHEVYNARVRSQSTKTIVVIEYDAAGGEKSVVPALALYSLSHPGSFYCLPPIPDLRYGLPFSYKCISLDGKLYVLGGCEEDKKIGAESDTVFVLDIAGERHWKKCACMKDDRRDFGCGVINGKIYVFGGVADGKPVRGSEVYDPKSDAWSPIAPMKYFGSMQDVTAVGEELFVYNPLYDDYPLAEYPLSDDQNAEVYHSLKNEWRIVDKFVGPILLTVGGKFIRLRWPDVEFYDSRVNSWTPSQTMSFAVSGLSDSRPNELQDIVVVDNDFLGFVGVWDDDIRGHFRLMRTSGLGCELVPNIVWQDLCRPWPLTDTDSPFLCRIQL